MAIPPGVIRVVFTGALPGGEIWSTGFWMLSDSVTDQATANAYAFLMDAEFGATDGSGGLEVTITTLCSPQVTWTKTTIYSYNTGGPHATWIGELVRPTPISGSASTTLPNQVALVLTLRTGFPGRRNRGRMYLPCNAVSVMNSGQVPTAKLDAVVNAWAAAFTDLNASDEGKAVVVSTVGSTARQISQVTMDSRLDIQRRRANSESIDHTSSQSVTP